MLGLGVIKLSFELASVGFDLMIRRKLKMIGRLL